MSDKHYQALLGGLRDLRALAESIAEPLADFEHHRQRCEKCTVAVRFGGATPMCAAGVELAFLVFEAADVPQQPSLLDRIIARLRR